MTREGRGFAGVTQAQQDFLGTRRSRMAEPAFADL
jgi:hypothetical protein